MTKAKTVRRARYRGFIPSKPKVRAFDIRLSRFRRKRAGKDAGKSARSNKVLEALTAARSWLYSIWIAGLTVAVMIVIYIQATSDVTLIELVAVPEQLRKQGFSSEVVAQRLANSIQRSYLEAKTVMAFAGAAPQSSQIDFQVPTVGISVKAITQQVRTLLGKHDSKVSGAITLDEDSLSLVLYFEDGKMIKRSVEKARPIEPKVEKLLEDAALEVLKFRNPYIAALKLYGQEVNECGTAWWCGFPSTREAIQWCFIRCRPEGQELAYLLLGRIAEREGDLEGALAFYRLARELDPRFFGGWFNEGNLYSRHHDYLAALAPLTKAAALASGSNAGKSQFELGYVYARMPVHDDYERTRYDEEALAHLEAAVRLGGDELGKAQYEIGKLQLKRDRYTSAVNALHASAVHLPGSPQTYFMLGCAFLATADYDGAAEKFKIAISLMSMKAPPAERTTNWRWLGVATFEAQHPSFEAQHLKSLLTQCLDAQSTSVGVSLHPSLEQNYQFDGALPSFP